MISRKEELHNLYRSPGVVKVMKLIRQVLSSQYFFWQNLLRLRTLADLVENVKIKRGYTNAGHQIAMATRSYTVAPNIFVPSVWNLLLVTLLAPQILRNSPRFLKSIFTVG